MNRTVVAPLIDPTTGEIMFLCHQWPMRERAKKLYTDLESDDTYEGFAILRSADDGATWKRTNLSESADRSSISLKVKKKKVPYPGDVGRSFVASNGNKVLAVWVSKYCASGSPTLRSEIRPMLTLAGPVVLAELGWMAMGTVDILMVGRLGPDAIGLGWIYQYALVDRSGNHDLAQLRSLQDWFLKYELQTVPGVAEVATVGGFGREYQVSVDPNRLLAYGIPIHSLYGKTNKPTPEMLADVDVLVFARVAAPV